MAAHSLVELQIKYMLEQQGLPYDESGLKSLLLDKNFLLQRSVLGGRFTGSITLQAQVNRY